MGKKKKDTMELRFYEVPQGEYVLALLGDNWIRDYGHDESNLHFHNLMEIGYCKNGTGELILNEDTKSLGNNKAPACESRGFCVKNRRGAF